MATLYNAKLGRVMLVMQRERRTTNFGRANDRLSRAASEITIGLRQLEEGYQMDRHFDGGEFSGMYYLKNVNDLYRHVAAKYHFANVFAMQKAMASVCHPYQVYMLFVSYTPAANEEM